MTIRKIQTRRLLQDVAFSHYATGHKPKLEDVLKDVSAFFSKNPAGSPLALPEGYVGGTKSNVEVYNRVMAQFAFNLEVLFEAVTEQLWDSLVFSDTVRTHLNALKLQRRRLDARLDDYMLSLYNADGYFYSLSDSFADINLIDLSLTSAHVDTEAGAVMLPTVSTQSKRTSLDEIFVSSMAATIDGVAVPGIDVVSPESQAFDSLENTAWITKLTTDSPKEVIAEFTVSAAHTISVSKIDFDPYGVSPVQVFIETRNRPASSLDGTEYETFGNKIETSSSRMMFTNELREATDIRFRLRKTEPDFVQAENGIQQYHYIFGAKDIAILREVFDRNATLVSEPIGLPAGLQDGHAMDALSLAVEEELQDGTELRYYFAADTGQISSDLNDFDWLPVVPVNAQAEAGRGSTNVRFNGATSIVKKIVNDPFSNDLKLIDLNSTNPDLKMRNPTPAIIPGVDVYRIAEFTDDFIPSSLKLEEGVNSTRIYHHELSSEALDIAWWKDKIGESASVSYGQTNSGNGFFYGGDVGEAGRSVYVETYLETDRQLERILSSLRKVDPNARTWDLRVFLNGRPIGTLLAGTDKMTVPWVFQEGLNHIALLINIPVATPAYPHPYIGVIELLNDSSLSDFGTVKLATWKYLDFFDVKYNESNQRYTFTIHDNEIISRRKPTTNFRLKYSKKSGKGPNAIRLRADFKRGTESQYVTPVLNGYRVRFAYS